MKPLPPCLKRMSWALWLVLAGAVQAQAPARESPAAPAGTNAPVRQISETVFQVGAVRLDKQARTVTFPALLNMNAGLIEYLVVTTSGKTHESLLRTDVEPSHLQVAMLLLGAKGAPGGWFPEPPAAGPIVGGKRKAAAGGAVVGNERKIPGESVAISVRWKIGGEQQQSPIENLVRDLRAKAPMARGPFTFNGSRVWNGVFTAQRDGSIIALITDADALFNNPRPGHELDDIWEVLPTELPPLGTPMELTLTLLPDAGKPRLPAPPQP